MQKVSVVFPTLSLPQQFRTLQPLVDLIRRQFTGIAGAINYPDFGATGTRPTQQLAMGQSFYDTTLAKPVWWNSSTSTWKDATGADV